MYVAVDAVCVHPPPLYCVALTLLRSDWIFRGTSTTEDLAFLTSSSPPQTALPSPDVLQQISSLLPEKFQSAAVLTQLSARTIRALWRAARSRTESPPHTAQADAQSYLSPQQHSFLTFSEAFYSSENTPMTLDGLVILAVFLFACRLTPTHDIPILLRDQFSGFRGKLTSILMDLTLDTLTADASDTEKREIKELIAWIFIVCIDAWRTRTTTLAGTSGASISMEGTALIRRLGRVARRGAVDGFHAQGGGGWLWSEGLWEVVELCRRVLRGKGEGGGEGRGG